MKEEWGSQGRRRQQREHGEGSPGSRKSVSKDHARKGMTHRRSHRINIDTEEEGEAIEETGRCRKMLKVEDDNIRLS